MKSTDTQTTTTAAKANTTQAPQSFFGQSEGSFFDQSSQPAFFSKQQSTTPAIQTKPDKAPAIQKQTATPAGGAPAATAATTTTSTPATNSPVTAGTPGTPAAGPRKHTPEEEAELRSIKQDANAVAVRIKNILTDNTYLTEGDSSGIMYIVSLWAMTRQQPKGTNLSAFDYLIVALGNQLYEIGWVASQTTSAFDEMFHRMDDDHVDEFKGYMQKYGRVFRNEKALDKVHFEMTTDQLIEGLELAANIAAAAAEVALAVASGSSSEVGVLGFWMINTLPELISDANAIVGTIKTVRDFNTDELKMLFSGHGVADLLVKAMFGKLSPLSVPAEGEKEEDHAAGKAQNEFIRVLNMIKKVIRAVLKAYREVAKIINGILGDINVSNKKFYGEFAMAYVMAVKAAGIIDDPGGSLEEATGELKVVVAQFFGGMKSKLDDVSGSIKEHLAFLLHPAEFLGMISEKAVEWVLNFMITHPPSPLFKALAKLIPLFSNKTPLQLLEEYVPFTKDIIQAIAGSKTIQDLLSPLQGPVGMISGTVSDLTGMAGAFIAGSEKRVMTMLNSGDDFIKQMVGSGPADKAGGKASGGDAGFLDTLKSGIHSHLMTDGEEQMKKHAADIGGKIIGWLKTQKEFFSNGEKHHIFLKGDARHAVMMVASDEMTVESLFKSKEEEIAGETGTEKIHKDDALKKSREIYIRIKVLIQKLPLAKKQEETQQLTKDMNTEFSAIVVHFAVLEVGRPKSGDLPNTRIEKEEKDGKAWRVKAEPLSKKPDPRYKPSRPIEDAKGWKEHIMTLKDYASIYVELHLLSQDLNGPGVTWNLTPGRKQENRNMEFQVETPVYNYISKNRVVWYEADITDYRKHPLEDFAEGMTLRHGFMERDEKGNWQRLKNGPVEEKTYKIGSPPEEKGSENPIPTPETMAKNFWENSRQATQKEGKSVDSWPNREVFRTLIDKRTLEGGFGSQWKFERSEALRQAEIDSPGIREWLSRLYKEGKLRKIPKLSP